MLAPTSTATTILYVEDNPVNVLLAERILELRPAVRLLAANDGAAGLALATTRQPDLIFLDLHLPDLGFEQVLQLLQVGQDTRDIPVVVVSADAMADDVARLRAAGAVDYLTKPFDLRQFLALIDMVMATAPTDRADRSEMHTDTRDVRIRALITGLTDAIRPNWTQPV